ncbi:MAG TPA: putative Ig domain-containing protein [Casimicrobiaceae bacterium]|nr:putative Ig domain-containing protein [Casimicrobiaceae bacterium]
MNFKPRRGTSNGISRLVPFIAGVLLGASAAAHADTYTYNYAGPTFTGGTDHVAVTFTTSAPLAPSTSYLSAADAGVISGAVTVVGPAGVVSGFTLPLSTFEIHTNATAGISSPGIDAWFVLGDASSLSGTSPTMTGTDFQAYTMNTMVFIPGSDIPGATGLVTGHYNYDQATETTFYASCSGIAGCTLAGNGQPYVGNYSGIINPANTSGANWTIGVNTTTPPPAPPPALAMTGSLPGGTVGVAYSSTALAPSGGVPPYTWSATGLPPGLSIAPATGAVSGTPTAAATYSLSVSVTDSASTPGATSTTLSMVIDPALVACSGSNAAISGVNKFWVDINGGLSGGGQSVVYAPQASTTFTGVTTTFVVGELIDYIGTVDGTGMCAATSMTVKPAPTSTPTYSCTKPSGAKSAQGKNKITAVGAGYIVVGSVTVQVPSCTVVSWNGATGFAVGQRAEYQGYKTGGVTVAAQITIN